MPTPVVPDPAAIQVQLAVIRQSRQWVVGTSAVEEVKSAKNTYEGRSLLWVVLVATVATLVISLIVVAINNLGPRPGATGSDPSTPTASKSQETPSASTVILAASATDFDPWADNGNGEEHPNQVNNATDDNPSMGWSTMQYLNSLQPGGLKPGVGLVLDFGKPVKLREIGVTFAAAGEAVELRAPEKEATDRAPMDRQAQWKTVAAVENTPERAVLRPIEEVTSRYVLVYLTKLPEVSRSRYVGTVNEIVAKQGWGHSRYGADRVRHGFSMTDGDLEIHVLVDSTGETAVWLARAARAQLPDTHFKIIRHPRLGKLGSIMKALGTLKERTNQPTAVFSTLVNAELRSLVINACEDLAIPYTDLMDDTPVALERISGHTTDEVPIRPVGMETDYFVRTSAMELATRNDDGAMPVALRECGICLVGASRSGETPLSIYLGYLGYKTVNVLLVPGIRLPEELFRVDRWRIVGLMIDAERLLQIRSRRVQGLGGFGTRDGYADLGQTPNELDEVGVIQRRLGVPIVDITGLVLEEAVARITDIVDERARRAGSRLRRPAGQLRIAP